VTYRLLSRLLGIHVNLAKQYIPNTMINSRMLNEFHQQSKIDGKSCHATYILSGLIEQPSTNDTMEIDEDFPMSSPLATQESSKSNGTSTRMIRTILLADENDVHGTKSS
jgi:DNA polymerase subunit Cdc27